ncbi:MAG: sigma-70 family RNA polymerase sigma factor [Prevotellaceae bacterium]|jgi:RNA polymerase sigma factor (sigma-70 family)|nr:sigma-70 family RNA polymerase sigma factor [Prevotellaceae bacterium]
MSATSNASSTVEQLVVKHQPRLKAFIRRRVTRKEDAEDILQDVLCQFAKTLETTMNPIEHVAAWLYRSARNAIINHGAKKRETLISARHNGEDGDEMLSDFLEVALDADASASPEAEYLRSLVWTALESALLELPREQREAFELTELEGLPVKDISQATGTPVNTLLSRKRYAVLHLRKRLAGLYEEFN